MSHPRICAAGDQALLVEFGDTYSKSVSNAVIAFDQMLQGARPPLVGLVETVPTLRSVLIQFDPVVIKPQLLEDWCRKTIENQDWNQIPAPEKGQRWQIPVIYGGENGSDLAEVAEIAGLTESQLIESHSSTELTVLCLGFSPGLAYLAELPEAFAIPRRKAYSKRPVPLGSILIANQQTVLPATPIQTGWWRIGVTPVPTFMPMRPKPFLLSPSDTVRFQPISEAESVNFDSEPLWDARQNEST